MVSAFSANTIRSAINQKAIEGDSSSRNTIACEYFSSFAPLFYNRLKRSETAMKRKRNESTDHQRSVLRVQFSKAGSQCHPLTLNNKELDLVGQVKVLGIIISNDLKWNCHVDCVIKKASKRRYFLRQLKVTVYLQGCLQSNRCSTCTLHRRYLNPIYPIKAYKICYKMIAILFDSNESASFVRPMYEDVIIAFHKL